MDGKTFQRWLDEMRSTGISKSDADAARQLDVHPNSIVLMKRNGTDHRTALACRALLHRLEAYA